MDAARVKSASKIATEQLIFCVMQELHSRLALPTSVGNDAMHTHVLLHTDSGFSLLNVFAIAKMSILQNYSAKSCSLTESHS